MFPCFCDESALPKENDGILELFPRPNIDLFSDEPPNKLPPVFEAPKAGVLLDPELPKENGLLLDAPLPKAELRLEAPWLLFELLFPVLFPKALEPFEKLKDILHHLFISLNRNSSLSEYLNPYLSSVIVTLRVCYTHFSTTSILPVSIQCLNDASVFFKGRVHRSIANGFV